MHHDSTTDVMLLLLFMSGFMSFLVVGAMIDECVLPKIRTWMRRRRLRREYEETTRRG